MLQQKTTRRWASVGISLLLGGHAVALFLSCPVVALMMLGSLWEGGDLSLKRRLLDLGPFAVVVALATGVLMLYAAVAVHRTRTEARLLIRIVSGLTLGLALGWVWVFRQDLFTDPSLLGPWFVMTIPVLLALTLFTLVYRPDGQG